MKIVAQNRKASHEYHLLERFEAGLVLQGKEVRFIRLGRISIAQAFVIHKDNELFLHNAHITNVEQNQGESQGQGLRADRKLLLHKRQIQKLIGSIARKGMTVVPTKIYLNANGFLKVEIALATGLKKHDKRQTIKEKEWKRNAQKILKQHNQAKDL